METDRRYTIILTSFKPNQSPFFHWFRSMLWDCHWNIKKSMSFDLIVSRSQFSNFSITNILGEEEGETGIDGNGEIISRIKQEKIDILGI